jgi:hypothetical protein
LNTNATSDQPDPKPNPKSVLGWKVWVDGAASLSFYICLLRERWNAAAYSLQVTKRNRSSKLLGPDGSRALMLLLSSRIGKNRDHNGYKPIGSSFLVLILTKRKSPIGNPFSVTYRSFISNFRYKNS